MYFKSCKSAERSNMKRTSKALSLFLSLALLFSVFSMTVSADGLYCDNVSAGTVGVGDMSDYYKDNLSWTIENGTLFISGTGSMMTYDAFNPAPWSSQCDIITSIYVSEGVTSIGAYAFYGLFNAQTVSLPESITSIGDYAFGTCSSLEEITLPSKITSIAYGTFYCCEKLEEITIPASVEVIANEAFCYCEGLKSITIPASVTFIGETATIYCTSLETIYGVKGSVAETFATDNGYTFVEKEEISESFNCAEGKPYTVNGAFLNDKVDDGKILTDGFIPEKEEAGKIVSFKGTGATSTITIDLGKKHVNINKIIVGGVIIGGNRQYGSAVIEISDDGVNYERFSGYIESVAVHSGTSHNYTYVPVPEVSARYVKISITNTAYVLTIGDIQVYGCEVYSDDSSEIPSEEPSTEIPSEEPSSEIPSEEPSSEISSEEPSAEIPSEEPSSEIPSEEPSSEIPSEEPSSEIPSEEPSSEIPSEEPSSEIPSDDECFMDEEASTMPNLTENTTVFELVSALKEYNVDVTITDKDGNELGDNAKVGTGCKVKTSDGAEYTVIVKGDIDGSGDVTTTDYLQLRKALVGDLTLENEYLAAADTNGTASLDSVDYIQIKSYFLGEANLYA